VRDRLVETLDSITLADLLHMDQYRLAGEIRQPDREGSKTW
jgi:hypothetical protein